MRAALFEQLFQPGKQQTTTGDGPDRRTALLEAARLSVAVLLTHFDTSPAVLLTHFDTSPAGLAPAEATNRLALFGPNKIAHERPPAWYVQLLAGFKNLFIAVLLTLAVVSFFTGDTKAVVVITVMVTRAC